jgi:amino acid transporter
LPDSETGSKPAVFVRDSTGLVKNVSFIDSIAMNLGNMSVGVALGGIGIAGLAPMLFAGQDLSGVNLVMLSIISFVLSFPQIIIYTIMSRRYPRSGGDYVYVSRQLGGPLGSVLSFMGYTMETTAYLALVVLSTVFAIGTVGLFFTFNTTYLGLAVPSGSGPGGNPTSQFLVGAIMFAGLIAVNILKPKAGFKLVTFLTAFGFLAVLLASGVLLGAGSTGVQNYINSSGGAFAINGSQTYSIVSNSCGFNTGACSSSFSLGPTIFLLPLIAAFVYPWLNASPAVASEIKGQRALKWNVPISSLLVFAFLTGSLAVMYATAGQAFTNQAYTNPTLVYGLPPAATSFNFFTLAMGVSGNTVVAAIIGLGWILANLSVLAYGIIVISRYLLAQSLDRFLPSKLADVSPRFGSPIIAHSVDLVITLALVGFAAFAYSLQGGIGGADALFGAIIASMIYFIFVGLSAALRGIRSEKGLTKAALVLAGIANVFVFGFLSYQFLANPDVWSLKPLTYIFVIGSVVVGALIYAYSWWSNKKRGVDISMAFKELPPE